MFLSQLLKSNPIGKEVGWFAALFFASYMSSSVYLMLCNFCACHLNSLKCRLQLVWIIFCQPMPVTNRGFCRLHLLVLRLACAAAACHIMQSACMASFIPCHRS